jgi:hypothetical protein
LLPRCDINSWELRCPLCIESRHPPISPVATPLRQMRTLPHAASAISIEMAGYPEMMKQMTGR